MLHSHFLQSMCLCTSNFSSKQLLLLDYIYMTYTYYDKTSNIILHRLMTGENNGNINHTKNQDKMYMPTSTPFPHSKFS